MKERYAKKVPLFAENAQKIKKSFPWQNALMKRTAALFYAAAGKEVDVDAIKRSMELLRASTGLFSAFRGNAAMSVATLLSLSDDPQGQLLNTLSVYALLREAKFASSDFLAMAAFTIAAGADPQNHADAVKRARAFYDAMKRAHPFLTGQDDAIFAAMLGLSDIGLAEGEARMERLFAALKPEFGSGGGTQALAQILTLAGESDEAVKRLFALRDAFGEKKLRFDKGFSLPSLGVLSLLGAGAEEVVSDTFGIFDFLKGQKGFGFWTTTKQELMIFAAALVAMEQAEEGILAAALSVSVANIMIAQQAAVMAAVAASSAGAVAASSH